MEHHIAQSSPISPRKKGMEGSRQALLYGVYDAFAGARSLISRRLCALITAIGIAVFTISSSAWATHPDITATVPTNPDVPAPDVEPGSDTNSGNQLQPNSVHTGDIGDGEVGNLDLADGAVTGGPGGKILDGSITSDDLQVVDTADPTTTPGAVGNGNIQGDAVTTDKIGAGEVCGSEAGTSVSCASTTPTTSDIGAGSIGETDLADDAVTENKILDDAVTNDKLAEVVGNTGTGGAVDTTNINTDAIDSRTIATGAVDNDELAPDAVETENIGAGEVCGSEAGTSVSCASTTPTTSDIGAGSIGTADLADGGVELADLNTDSVNSDKIVDGSVELGDLDTDSVNSDKIVDDTITSADLKSYDPTTPGLTDAQREGAVTTDKINPEAVTTDKLKKVIPEGMTGAGTEGAVNTDNINTDAIDSRTIGDGEVTNADLKSVDTMGPTPGQNGAVSTDKINDEAVTSNKLADVTSDTGAAVNTANIVNGAVEDDKIAANAVCGSADRGADCGGLDAGGNPVERTHIRAGTIGTNDLAEVNMNTGLGGAVNEVNINNLAVSERTIQDDAVTEGKIRDDAVTENKILDDAVTSDKLANVGPGGTGGAVNNDNINTDAINSRTLGTQVVCGSGDPNADCNGAGEPKTHIKAGSIGTNDLANFVVTADKIGFNQVLDRHIADRAVRANHIGLGQVGLEHFGDDVNNLFRRIEGDIDRLDEGIAMSHAISMIKVPEGKEFGISFAGGFYQDKQAAAIGVGFRPSDGLLLSAGASYGFDSEEVGGAVSINFGF